MSLTGHSNFKIIAVDDKFVPAASIDSAHKKLGLDTESMINTVLGENANG